MTDADTPSAVRVLQRNSLPHELRDYALLADGQRGILADPDGELAWMCFPTWSDPAVLASLLGSRGSYRIQPKGRYVPGGAYEDGTLIWRQRWVTDNGVIECRQALAYPGRPDRAVILRRVSALDSEAHLSAFVALAGDYGRRPSGRWRRDDAGGTWETSVDGIHARWSGAADAEPVASVDGPAIFVEFHVDQGHTHDFVLELQRTPFEVHDRADADELWRQTTTSWSTSIPQCREMPAGRDVRQSFATLRGLTDADGATVAAVTTALPERAEAGRNYDYRYGWIRDICYIGQAGAAVDGGEPVLDDAVRWVCARILSDGVSTTPAYRGDGSPVPEPLSLGLARLSRRLRCRRQPGPRSVPARSLRRGSPPLGERRLARPPRHTMAGTPPSWPSGPSPNGPTRRTTGSGRSGRTTGPTAGLSAPPACGPSPSTPRRRATSRLPCRWLITYSAPPIARPCILRAVGSDHRAMRASTPLFCFPKFAGPSRPDDPRSVATRLAVIDELCEDDYIYRYAEPGEPLGQNEGAFLICNFWMSLAYLGCGETTKGAQYFERTRASCSSSGLFSEEYDVAQRQLRGNLPQAFVHALLIETAAAIGRS